MAVCFAAFQSGLCNYESGDRMQLMPLAFLQLPLLAGFEIASLQISCFEPCAFRCHPEGGWWDSYLVWTIVQSGTVAFGGVYLYAAIYSMQTSRGNLDNIQPCRCFYLFLFTARQNMKQLFDSLPIVQGKWPMFVAQAGAIYEQQKKLAITWMTGGRTTAVTFTASFTLWCTKLTPSMWSLGKNIICAERDDSWLVMIENAEWLNNMGGPLPLIAIAHRGSPMWETNGDATHGVWPLVITHCLEKSSNPIAWSPFQHTTASSLQQWWCGKFNC